jgi:hypothetical protein
VIISAGSTNEVLEASYAARLSAVLRIESVFPNAIDTILRNLCEGVVGAVEDRVLAEHGHIESLGSQCEQSQTQRGREREGERSCPKISLSRVAFAQM